MQSLPHEPCCRKNLFLQSQGAGRVDIDYFLGLSLEYLLRHKLQKAGKNDKINFMFTQ